LTTNFGDTSAKIYVCFERKTAFVMLNFWTLADSGGGMNFFDKTKPPKGTSLVVLSHYAYRSIHRFLL